MSQQGSSRALACAFIAAVSFNLAAAGCGAAARGDEKASGQDKALARDSTSNAVVLAWNKIAVDAAVAFDNYDTFENHRGVAMMHLAIHDAINATEPMFAQYAYLGSQPEADPIAATAQAGRDVLASIYPKQKSTFDAQLATWLATVPSGDGKTRGIQLGKDAAAAIIAARQGDGMDTPPQGDYTPGKEPGNYQYVPPFDFCFKPKFGESKPFSLSSSRQFRPGPPPALTSAAYASSYDEVKGFGGKGSTLRTQDQTNLANWWYEGSGKTWNKVATLLARQRNLSLHRSARLFALVNVAIIDSFVAVWDAKMFYDFWRPYTAIRAAAKDGNPKTAPDQRWESLLVTPPVQDYPSALATEAAAAAGAIRAFFDSDNVPFSIESSSALPDAKVRSFKTLTQAAEEAAESRVMCGLHFRFATDAGFAMGAKIANHVVSSELRPRAGDQK